MLTKIIISGTIIILILMINAFRTASPEKRTDTIHCLTSIAFLCGILILIGIPWQIVVILFDISACSTIAIIVYAEELED